MRHNLRMLGAGLLTALFCVGCAGAPAPQPEDTRPVYSNLTDEAARSEAAEALERCGVTAEQTDTLYAWAEDFNSRVLAGELPQGFVPLGEDGAAYDGLVVGSREGEDGLLCPEANCRLTSYLLMKNLTETNGKRAEDDSILIFDVEAIDTYAPFHLTEEERTEFLSLFSWVPLEGADTLEGHTERIQDAWKDRDVQIGGEGISLITVYLHLPYDDVRFVGHTGVLTETEEGLLFVEKYGPQLPFQATRFRNREELKRYLLQRPDLYGDETELPPIVMENDHVL